jgi:hypothetical protein
MIWYLIIMISLELTYPIKVYALTGGPSQPEFGSFTPIGTSDMVDLASGDFNYNIPVMDVGGYPLNLAYNSGVTMDEEASWVGLGWNLNVGQINRDVRGLPDDFKGEEITTEDNLKDNLTVGIRPYINFQIIGMENESSMSGQGLGLSSGLDIQYNNYSGLSAVTSFGASYAISQNVSVGIQLSSSADNGVDVTPSLSLSTNSTNKNNTVNKFGATVSPSITYNSRQGLQSFNLASSFAMRRPVKMDTGQNTQLKLGWGLQGSSGISFANTSFTPSKRLAFKNNSFQFSFSLGTDVYGFHIEGSTTAYASLQKIKDKVRHHKAYGYEFTESGNENALLDFNREKEQAVLSKYSTVLPVTNYTYDIYSIRGQEIGGMFRPVRSQIGHVYDPKVVDGSGSNSFGAELEIGAGVHYGVNFKKVDTRSHTGNWDDAPVIDFFKEKSSGNAPDYEKVFFRSPGEVSRDPESQELLTSWLGEDLPITLKLDGGGRAVNNYQKKVLTNGISSLTNANTLSGGFSAPLKRQGRQKRNQVTQKVTGDEVQKHSLHKSFFKLNPHVKPHHTAGYIVTDAEGRRHIYGETAYNIEKQEVSFAVGDNASDCSTGLVQYDSYEDNSLGNRKGRDNYFNRVITPAYAHTYLLTSVLSTDYEDRTGNGPSDDDLGSYTKFSYTDDNAIYQWRIPFEENKASYNEGLKTDKGKIGDQKGSYIYGRKENKYLKRIETKTHVAFIDLEPRMDGHGVKGYNGGGNVSESTVMYCVKRIRLYSKPQLQTLENGYEDPGLSSSIRPIKTAVFTYDYSLCQGVPNNFNSQNGAKGKLTLKSVYFTYGRSNMGMYTPYKFEYSASNPSYNVKNYDIWGNFKENPAGSCANSSTATTPQEFPYVDQSDPATQDFRASSWLLTSVELPSGGKLDFHCESDDYQYVQDRKAMQMFKVAGVVHTSGSETPSASNITQYLYGGDSGTNRDFVAIKLNPSQMDTEDTPEEVVRKYTAGLEGKPIYFNFLLNMKDEDFEYVPGYFIMDGAATYQEDIVNNARYLFIPMKKLNREGKDEGSDLTNPIAITGWMFGRKNLNRYLYNDYDTDEVNVVALANAIAGSMEEMLNIFKGPNQVLKDDKVARDFKKDKSWIRLLEPTGAKIGGGSRVKSIVMFDQWDEMLNVTTTPERYAKHYGQEYNYNLENGTSSGVATYEPNISKENPLVEPLYSRPERLLKQTFQEKPFGECFFPAPMVTYSRVAVRNLSSSSEDTRTGMVITEHFTCFDFPTIADYTALDKGKKFDSNEDEMLPNLLKSTLGLPVTAHNKLYLSQGFTVQTNDMNGKVSKQTILNEQNAVVSSVQYKYSTSTDDAKRLDNHVKVIDATGNVSEDYEIGVDYDVINDFRESYSNTSGFGMSANLDTMIFGPVVVLIGMVMPERQTHLNILKTAATTKVIHRTGILTETIAKDLGSVVSTKNLAWDADTGQVLLTETANEFNDKYYSLSFPARWFYKDMGMSSDNIDLTGELSSSAPYYSIDGISNLSTIFNLGDELLIEGNLPVQGSGEALFNPNPEPSNSSYAWVVAFNSTKTEVCLMNREGLFYNPCGDSIPRKFRVIRSGKRNLQMQAMAAITTISNPLDHLDTNNSLDLNYLASSPEISRVINASAVTYTDFWRGQEETAPYYPYYRENPADP